MMRHLRFPAIAFMAMTISMLAAFLLLPQKTYSSTERRYLAEAPTVTWQSLVNGEVSEGVEDYLTDHFPGRNLFVGIHTYWNLLTGRNAAGSVYHCSDDYLIKAPENCPMEQFEKNLSRFDAFAAQMGLPAHLLMIPTAGDVLDKLLPAGHPPYHYTECLAKAQQLCQTLSIPDLQAALSAVSNQQLYYKTDHHLTSAGCYAVYSAFCRANGQQPLPESAYQITAYDGFHGANWTSSGYWLTPAEQIETWDAELPLTVTISEPDKPDIVSDSAFFLDNLTSDDLYTVFLDGNHALVRISNPAATGGKLLILRDSYAHCLAPFLAANYSEIILVDLRYYRYPVSELIAQNGITELAVIFGLDNLLTDSNSGWLS